MDRAAIQRAVEMSEAGLVFVTSADAQGVPHLAAAGRLAGAGQERVAVMEWFCPGTVDNVQHNRRVSIVVWDPGADTGYQLEGQVEKMEPEMVMDGYLPEEERKEPLPQVERKFVVRVRRVLDFSLAPHSDRVE